MRDNADWPRDIEGSTEFVALRLRECHEAVGVSCRREIGVITLNPLRFRKKAGQRPVLQVMNCGNGR